VPEFAGINHLALTVTDLDVSQRFYCDLLGFVVVLDVGYGRICIHRGTGFTIALLRPSGASGDRFSPLRTGLDHLGLAVGSRAELVEWELRLHAAGVPCAPIQDMPLGHHLNFTDPDGIALELQAPNAVYAAALVELRGTVLSDDEVRDRAARLLAAPGGSGGADLAGAADR
jgi:glyoxylase I family protein